MATDMKAKNQLDKVELVATRNGVAVIRNFWDLTELPAGDYELPGSFGLYSPDGSQPRVEVRVRGFRDNAEVTRRESILSLVSGQTLFVRMALVGGCSVTEGPTCEAGESCIEGVCRKQAIDPRSLPKFDPRLVTGVACRSGSHFIVSSTGAPMTELGTSCKSDEYCEEGVCYKLPPGADGSLAQGIWVQELSPTTYVLRAIWGTPDGAQVIAVGEAGTIVRRSASTPMAATGWMPDLSPTAKTLYAISGSDADDVWAAGVGGTIVHYDGTSWQIEPSPTSALLTSVWVPSRGHVFIAGRDGDQPILLERVGGAWQIVAVTAPGDLRAIHGRSPEDAWAVGHGGTLLHFDGMAWTAVEGAGDFSSVVNDVVVGRRGLAGRLEGGAFVAEESGTSIDLFGLFAVGDQVFAVGDYGVILARDAAARSWSAQASGTAHPLFGGWGSSADDLFSVGRDGIILHYGSGTPPDLGMACVTPGCPCAADSDCDSTLFCSAGSTCELRKAQGTACADADCKSSGCRVCAGALSCTDGVCCDKAAADCSGCMQCTAPSGVCSAVVSGTDPRGACASAMGECQQTTCNGQGSCANTGNPCGSTTCASGMLTTYACANGVCAPNSATLCPAPPACNGNLCSVLCAGDADCAASAYCDNLGNCAPRKPQAGSCNTQTHCKVAGCRECQDTFQCVDGRCCNSACTGKCQACDVSGMEGTCSTVTSGQPHGARGACSGSGVCQGYCSAADAMACTFPTSVCIARSCQDVDTQLNAATCGSGSCGAQTTTECAPFACVGTTCRKACLVDSDCAPGFACHTPTRNCLLANGERCLKPDQCASQFCITNFCCEWDCPPSTRGCTKPNAMGISLSTASFSSKSCSTGKCDLVPDTEQSCSPYACDPIEDNCYTTCETAQQCYPQRMCVLSRPNYCK